MRGSLFKRIKKSEAQRNERFVIFSLELINVLNN